MVWVYGLDMSTEPLSADIELNLLKLIMKNDGLTSDEIKGLTLMTENQYRELRSVVEDSTDRLLIGTLMQAVRDLESKLAKEQQWYNESRKSWMEARKEAPEVIPQDREYVPTRRKDQALFNTSFSLPRGRKVIDPRDVVCTYAEEFGIKPTDPIAEEITKFYAWLRDGR